MTLAPAFSCLPRAAVAAHTCIAVPDPLVQASAPSFPVPSLPRRIFLYWLLLLVPAIIVGAVAIQLLRREDARLSRQGAAVEEARRAALATQVRLVAENVELFAGDVQTGLLDTLAAEPAAGLDAFLDRWEKANPLVRITFRGREDGRLIRPARLAAGEEALGFVRRFAREFADRPPWGERFGAATAVPLAREEKNQTEATAVRKVAEQNVLQAQSARRDLQSLLSSRDYAATDAAAAATPAGSSLGRREAVAEAKHENAVAAPAAQAPRVASVGASAPAPALKDATGFRRGWQPFVIDGRLHLVGWVQPAGGGEIRGLELQMAAFVSRLGGAMPVEVGGGEGVALRDEKGRVVHQRGIVPGDGGPVIRLPVAAGILPGWEVVGFLPATAATGSAPAGAALLWVGVMLVGIFVAAIVAGGSLLLRQARRSAVEAAQKTSFVANVSHEFKTPLTTIRLYAELLEQGRVREAEQGRAYLRTIGRETQRLARLVNNALDFSRLEQGRKKYARESLDLGAELARLLETHEPRVAEAGMKLQRKLPAAALPIRTDRDACEQIVINLLDNACKYAAGGGEIEVEVRARADGGAEVRVADRGPGVPAEHRERIFEQFFRVDDALTAEKSGAGLGLSIARQLARGLGGDLRCVARIGGGAEFILELP